MKYITEPERELPVAYEPDVLVVGGGPAGFSAAVNAARTGARTMLVEQAGDVGGIATSGMMSHWTGATRGGFYEEIIRRTSDSAELPAVINTEKLRTEMLRMLREENVELLLYTFACGVIMDGDTLTGVIIENKSGRQAITAKIIIDASGDGDIAAKAGVPYIKGREEDGKMQPVTIMFRVAGVDFDRAIFPGGFEDNFPVPAGPVQDLGKAKIPFPAGHVLLYRSTLPGIVTCNMTNIIDIDGTVAADLTAGTALCREQMPHIVEFLREYVPGYERCYIIGSASLLGVRETRHFAGEYTLTGEDILNATVFDDWVVAKAHFNFDVHNITGPGLDETGVQKMFPQSKGYTIPYRCLVPLKVENLLLAGRNISGTHMAHSNYRVMPICANMGLAAGIAAAMCARDGITPRRLDVKKLQEKLKIYY